MTVAELISRLKDMPPDCKVRISVAHDYSTIDVSAKDVQLAIDESRTVILSNY
jgi:hypothetical protein